MNARKSTERLPGTPDQVRTVRRIIETALGHDHPYLDDAVLLGNETATNAVLHSNSARPGGAFALTVEPAAAWARVTIRDEGSQRMPCLCPVGPAATHGRGVKLLDTLALRWGLMRENDHTEVWFEVGR